MVISLMDDIPEKVCTLDDLLDTSGLTVSICKGGREGEREGSKLHHRNTKQVLVSPNVDFPIELVHFNLQRVDTSL